MNRVVFILVGVLVAVVAVWLFLAFV